MTLIYKPLALIKGSIIRLYHYQVINHKTYHLHDITHFYQILKVNQYDVYKDDLYASMNVDYLIHL